jgi:hypothetical protein
MCQGAMTLTFELPPVRTIRMHCFNGASKPTGHDRPSSGEPSEHQEANDHAEDDEGQGDAQHPANDARCLALPRLSRSIFRWWLVGHAKP